MADHSSEDEKAVRETGHDAAVHESTAPPEMSAVQYATTRFSTLKPPMHKAPNPIRLLRMLTGKQWLFWLVGFVAWVNFLPSPHFLA